MKHIASRLAGATLLAAALASRHAGHDLRRPFQARRGVSATRVMPHFGHLPGLSWRTSGCIGHVNIVPDGKLPAASVALDAAGPGSGPLACVCAV